MASLPSLTSTKSYSTCSFLCGGTLMQDSLSKRKLRCTVLNFHRSRKQCTLSSTFWRYMVHANHSKRRSMTVNTTPKVSTHVTQLKFQSQIPCPDYPQADIICSRRFNNDDLARDHKSELSRCLSCVLHISPRRSLKLSKTLPGLIQLQSSDDSYAFPDQEF